jgi:hypothetical protein
MEEGNMIEAGVLLDQYGRAIYWHLPEGRSAGHLPDSRALWDVIWEHREHVAGFAHTHPGTGFPSPSAEDLTTFLAIEAALGRRLDWWILSEDAVVCIQRSLTGSGSDYHPYSTIQWSHLSTRPFWAIRLRELSGFPPGKWAGRYSHPGPCPSTGDDFSKERLRRNSWISKHRAYLLARCLDELEYKDPGSMSLAERVCYILATELLDGESKEGNPWPTTRPLDESLISWEDSRYKDSKERK